MPDLQEILALAIVVIVAGLYLHRRRRRPSGSCGDCASAGPPPAESTVRFYRRSPAPGGHDGERDASQGTSGQGKSD